MAGAQTEMQVGRPSSAFSRAVGQTPWWLVIILVVGAFVLFSMLSQQKYVDALRYLLSGVGLTVFLSVVSYAVALVLGLVAGLGRVSHNKLFYTLATLYVEIVRGVPLLVIILYAHFVVAPAIGTNRNAVFSGIMALSFGYGAYLAEVYRAGIESIERGQTEAARSLGMSYSQAMRYVVLPQAIRRVLPPLGNDFIAILKDSSLVSAIAVEELTQLGRIQAARTFDTFRTFNAVAVLYLILTLLLSLGVRYLERMTSSGRR
ncbi:MAG TPA: amino acid ABC transporter permease [Herpetosiphonaceae bacterium]|nr:amino acid ABC transporter permease [Herpetosiphonaceae bacterium]